MLLNPKKKEPSIIYFASSLENNKIWNQRPKEKLQSLSLSEVDASTHRQNYNI